VPNQGEPKAEPGAPDVDDSEEILQFRVWLKGVSPMIWRRFQVPAKQCAGSLDLRRTPSIGSKSHARNTQSAASLMTRPTFSSTKND
jgi:hypothetical protein